MQLSHLESVEKQICGFIQGFQGILGRSDRCQKCGQYLCGLLLDGDRKSIEPMASRLPSGNSQALQQFVADSPWSFEALQTGLVDFMQRKLQPKASQSALILDDTSFPKQGKSSVGVARQYCGALGKIANCQVLVSWQYAEGSPRQLHFPLISELYLPQSWIDSPDRMKQAKVPESRWGFREKWRIALDLLDHVRDLVPHEACLFDAGYGEVREFMRELDRRGERFIAQIPDTHGFWPSDVSVYDEQPDVGRPRKYPEVDDPDAELLTAKEWGQKLLKRKKDWRTIRLPQQRENKVKVASVRVRERLTPRHRRAGLERWLLIEQHADGSLKYYVSSFPEDASIRRMIRLAHSRYKIEQGYQQLKEELGLDHYEGRSWQGLHHHIALCFMAFDFLVLMQKQQASKKRPINERPAPRILALHAA